MDISIHYAFLPHTDGEAALGFYPDTLGFEVRQASTTRTCAGSPSRPRGSPTAIVQHPPAVDPGVTDAERAVVLDLRRASTRRSPARPDGLFDRMQTAGADVVQKPTDQDYGVRDCAFRDLVGNLIRMNQRVAA
ncbi:VOC family protein [Microbacterium sp. CH12i]|uniref:VOC family protein n=1 Tax=Microbacterium sp. CH12i TaxID=1479651 RepID=UPI00055D41FD|nr:VOC family protein [Microbacterium sp. CH12i]